MFGLYFKLFSLSFGFMYLGGVYLIYILKQIGYYKNFNIDVIYDAALFYCIFCVAYISVGFLRLRCRSFNIAVGLTERASRLSLVISILAIVLYIYFNGFVLFKFSGYSARYESNSGFGVVTLMMLSFYVYVSLRLYQLQYSIGGLDKFFWINIFVFLILTFVVLGGHRQLGLGALIGAVIYIASSKRRGYNFIVIWSLIFLLMISGAALVRYGFGFSGGGFEMALIYFFDSVTPINAHADILNYSRGRVVFPDLIYNQFLAYIPRFVWGDKPMQILNGGNYYTSYVLGFDDFITYSPTVIGELILAHGRYFWLGGIFAGVLLSFIDKLIRERGLLSVALIVYSPILIFNLYREGFYVFLSRFSMYLIIFFAITFVVRMKRGGAGANKFTSF